MHGRQDANKLRWLGEAADGDRDKDCVVVWNGTKLQVVEKSKAGLKAPLGISVRTNSHGPGMRGGKPIDIAYDGKSMRLKPEVDAIFLTQSAVEKFVIPYYTRMQSLEWIIEKRDALFNDAKVLAAIHAYPSITSSWPPKTMLQPLGFDDETGDLKIL